MNSAEGFEQAAIATVTPREGKGFEQARDAVILDRTIVAVSLVAEGAGDPAFAKPGCPSVAPVMSRFSLRSIQSPPTSNRLEKSATHLAAAERRIGIKKFCGREKTSLQIADFGIPSAS